MLAPRIDLTRYQRDVLAMMLDEPELDIQTAAQRKGISRPRVLRWLRQAGFKQELDAATDFQRSVLKHRRAVRTLAGRGAPVPAAESRGSLQERIAPQDAGENASGSSDPGDSGNPGAVQAPAPLTPEQFDELVRRGRGQP